MGTVGYVVEQCRAGRAHTWVDAHVVLYERAGGPVYCRTCGRRAREMPCQVCGELLEETVIMHGTVLGDGPPWHSTGFYGGTDER